MKVRITALLCCTLLAAQSQAAQNATEAYGYGMAIHPERSGAFYALELPQAVYAHTAHGDLRDIRVINGEGEEVPVWIRQQNGRKPQEEERRLPFFPLHQGIKEASGASRIHVVTNTEGAIVDIDEGEKAQGGGYYYIVDASAVKGNLKSLKLKWDRPPVGRIITFRLESSADLHSWRKLESATLSYLEFGGQSLYQDEIRLPTHEGRYLRITPEEKLEGHKLSSLLATISQQSIEEEPGRPLRLTARLDSEQNAFLYDAGARLPIRQLNVDLGADNAVVDCTLYARAGEGDEWTRLTAMSFYHYTIQGKQTRNSPHRVHGMWRYFKLEPQQKSGKAKMPELELAWRPHQLVFMGQGSGPYQLVYGRGDSQPTDSKRLAELIENMKPEESEMAIVPSALDQEQVLCGAPCLALPAAPINYTRYLLWTLIVVGTGLVVWLVVRLSREMKGERQG